MLRINTALQASKSVIARSVHFAVFAWKGMWLVAAEKPREKGNSGVRQLARRMAYEARRCSWSNWIGSPTEGVPSISTKSNRRTFRNIASETVTVRETVFQR